MKSILLTCVILIIIFSESICSDLEDFNKHFRLIPYPQKVEIINAKGLIYSDLKGVFLKNTNQRPVMEGMLDRLPLSDSQADGILSLIINNDLSLTSPEAYSLEIRDKQVIIRSKEQAGLFYGIQTLMQLLEDSQDQQREIPACIISDFPEIAYRAIHIDLKHHLDIGKYYYDLIDRLSRIKINAIIIEFEDKLRYRKAPIVGSADAISIEEFAAICRYAKERFIEISPLIQGLGHASFILKHEEFRNLRDDPASDWVFDPLNPATYVLQFSLYEDAIAATPYGKYLHVGGDEVGELGKSSLSKKSGKNSLELQMYWLKKVSEFASEHNRIPIFWDDMVFKLSGLYQTTYDPDLSADKVQELWKKNRPLLDKGLPLFPAGCMFMRWNYDCPQIPGNQMAIDWYKSNGLNVMAATAASCIEPVLPRSKNHFQPIKNFCRLTSEKKMSGILCTVWDDCSPHTETVMRGLFDFAFFSWNYAEVPVEKLHAAFRQRFYGSELEPATFEFQDLLEEAVSFWETALLQSGDRENFHKSFQLINLPDRNKAGEWSEKSKDKLLGARNSIKAYAEIKARIAKAMELSRRNRYNLEIMNQINELLVYPSNLLILLEAYDKALSEDKEVAAIQLKKYITGFSNLRSEFENVYSLTRIMGNPEGYQLDSNFHEHLANGTNNTDWMFMYELPFNKKVLQLLSGK
jgi:hexosaminidase